MIRVRDDIDVAWGIETQPPAGNAVLYCIIARLLDRVSRQASKYRRVLGMKMPIVGGVLDIVLKPSLCLRQFLHQLAVTRFRILGKRNSLW
jgi:hypothetical protein